MRPRRDYDSSMSDLSTSGSHGQDVFDATSPQRVRFGRTELSVSRLGFGGAPIGVLKTERERVATMLNLMLDAGVNLIDTAAMYRGSEAMIGETIGHRRDEFVLVSKCGHALDDTPGDAWSPELVTATVDRALKNLRTDRLDVMLLHSCDLETLKRGDALAALVRARDAGKVRHVGYSGDNDAAKWAVAQPDIEVLQTSVNIADQANIDSVLPVAVTHDVGVMAKRPIANAAWKELADQPGSYAEYAKSYTERLRAMAITPEQFGFVGDARETWPELALRFTLSHPSVHVAIIGTTNPDNAHANLAAAARGALQQDTVDRIRDAFATARAGADWPGLT